MEDKKRPSSDDADISKNVRWDKPEVNPESGQTISKPPKSLDPNKQRSKD